jgi:hypothetical protein
MGALYSSRGVGDNLHLKWSREPPGRQIPEAPHGVHNVVLERAAEFSQLL